MNALGCLYHAGIASTEDWMQVQAWEAMRYDLTVCPTPAKVAAMTRHVSAILRAFEDER